MVNVQLHPTPSKPNSSLSGQMSQPVIVTYNSPKNHRTTKLNFSITKCPSRTQSLTSVLYHPYRLPILDKKHRPQKSCNTN